jgi:hypothetical protein
MKHPSNDALDAPFFLPRIWLKLSNATPTMCFPGTKLDFGFAILWAALFFTFRIIVIQIMLCFGWPEGEKVTSDSAASAVAGLFQSPNLVPVLFVLLTAIPYMPSAAIEQYPKWWQNCTDAMLQMCTGYMIYDSLVIVRAYGWNPMAVEGDDFLYLVHHFMTTFYMTSTRIVGAGQASALMCMFLGEASNPTFNLYLFCKNAMTLDCCNGVLMQKMLIASEVLAAIWYLPFRAVLGPIILGLNTTIQLSISKSARKNIPLLLRLIWIAMIWAVLLGSVPWIIDFWNLLMENLGLKEGAKDEL